MNKILRHGEGNNFPLPHTKKRQYEKNMGVSVCTIAANVFTFLPTKSSQPTFLFNNNKVYRNKNTIEEENKKDNNTTNNTNNNDRNDQEVFYGIAI